MTGTSSPASVPLTNHSSVVPSEVGWQFVPQYYTFVNKEPHRLHCFYNKNSTFIHGTEGEDGKPCYGQQVRFFSTLLVLFRFENHILTSPFFNSNSKNLHLTNSLIRKSTTRLRLSVSKTARSSSTP